MWEGAIVNGDDEESTSSQRSGMVRPTELITANEWEKFAKELGKLIGRRAAEETIQRRKTVPK